MYMVLYGIIILTIHFQFRNSLSLSNLVLYIIIYTGIVIKTTKKPKKVFVSYTIRDYKVDKTSLKYLNGILRKNNFICYIDLLHNNSINKQEKVYRELLSCDIFLIIRTNGYQQSEWTIQESKIAKDTKKKIVEITTNDNSHDIITKIKKQIKP